MPRIARKEIATSFFHVMVQGINKELIFDMPEMKKEYLKLLKQYNPESEVQIIAYCIMDNHVHLLLYTPNVEAMTKYMHKVNTSYAIYYNYVKKDRVGYVFRDRYKTQSILTKKQLGKCINYIHKNPVKARVCDKCEEYIYSSYTNYIKMRDIAPILNEIGVININQIESMGNSEEFLEEEIDKEKILSERISEFTQKYGDTEQIKKDREILKKLVKYLKDGYKITYVDIMKRLNLTKGQIEKLKR